MALRHAVLATLVDGPASGYELAKRFDAGVAHYWHATAPQLYQELGRMESDGLVTGTDVAQRDRPNKRVMTITDRGLAELERFVGEPSRRPVVKEDVLVKVRATDVVTEATRLVSDLRRLRERAQDTLAGYRRTEQLMLRGRTHDDYVATARRLGPYLTLRRGIRFEEENVAWLDETIAALTQRAHRADRQPQEART